MKKTLSLVLALITLLFCLVGCNNSKEIVLTDEDIHTDYAGVYLTLSSVDDSGEHKKLNAVWHNETFKEVTYGEGYKIEYLEDGEWKSVLKGEHIVMSIAYLLEAKDTKEKSYSTELFDLSKEGTYRLISDFSLGDGKTYNTWVTFEVKETSTEATNNGIKKLIDLAQYSAMTIDGTTSIEVVYDYIEGEEKNYEFVIEDQETIGKIMTEVFKLELKDYPDDRDIDIYQRWIIVKQGDNRYHIDLTLASDGEKQYICRSQNLREIIETYIEGNLIG